MGQGVIITIWGSVHGEIVKNIRRCWKIGEPKILCVESRLEEVVMAFWAGWRRKGQVNDSDLGSNELYSLVLLYSIVHVAHSNTG